MLEAPFKRLRADHFPEIGLLMIGTGNANTVAGHTILKTDDGDLDMGPVIVHHQHGVRARAHGDRALLSALRSCSTGSKR
jgi:hypothetical protein